MAYWNAADALTRLGGQPDGAAVDPPKQSEGKAPMVFFIRLRAVVAKTCLVVAAAVLCPAQMCVVSDVDVDADGWPDSVDRCPLDPNKRAPGFCGCGSPETDTDGDGGPDCIDQFPDDPLSIYHYHDVDDDDDDCGCGGSDNK